MEGPRARLGTSRSGVEGSTRLGSSLSLGVTGIPRMRPGIPVVDIGGYIPLIVFHSIEPPPLLIQCSAYCIGVAIGNLVMLPSGIYSSNFALDVFPVYRACIRIRYMIIGLAGTAVRGITAVQEIMASFGAT